MKLKKELVSPACRSTVAAMQKVQILVIKVNTGRGSNPGVCALVILDNTNALNNAYDKISLRKMVVNCQHT